MNYEHNNDRTLPDLTPTEETINFLNTIFSLCGGYRHYEKISERLHQPWETWEA